MDVAPDVPSEPRMSESSVWTSASSHVALENGWRFLAEMRYRTRQIGQQVMLGRHPRDRVSFRRARQQPHGLKPLDRRRQPPLLPGFVLASATQASTPRLPHRPCIPRYFIAEPPRLGHTVLNFSCQGALPTRALLRPDSIAPALACTMAFCRPRDDPPVPVPGSLYA